MSIKDKTISISTLISVGIVLIGIFSGFTIMNYATYYETYNYVLLGVYIIFISNCIFCFFKFKKRTIALLFHGVIFLFLLSRPTVAFLWGNKWWTVYSIEANMFAVYAIAISMSFIIVGVCLMEGKEYFFPTKLNSLDLHKKTIFHINIETLKKASAIILFFCFICVFIREIEKMLVMRGHPYEDLFKIYSSRLPSVLNLAANIMPYILCVFLALMPKKRTTVVVLFFYIASALPMLKIGSRNGFILNCVFAFVYFFIREIYEKNKDIHWIGKLEKTLIVIALPIVIVGAGALNYTRSDESVKLSVGNLIVDFVYKQGTTYDTVLQGYTFRDQFITKENRFYTISTITDYIYHSKIGNLIFNKESVGSNNGLQAVYNGGNLAHELSYTVLGDQYLAGAGRGSSYIVENYLDMGYVGVAIFSTLIGIISSAFVYYFNKKWFLSTVILCALLNFFFLPRDNSLGFFSFFYSTSFWIAMVGTIISSKLLDIILHNHKFIEFMKNNGFLRKKTL